MQLTKSLLALLPLALSVAGESEICTPWKVSVPDNVRNLSSDVTTAWAKDLCATLTFQVDSGFEIVKTPIADGVLGDDGQIWGLQVASHLLRDINQCLNYATSVMEDCLGSLGFDGGLMTGPTPFELFANVVRLTA